MTDILKPESQEATKIVLDDGQLTNLAENEPAGKSSQKPLDRDSTVEVLRFAACSMAVLCHFFTAFLPIAAYGPTSPALLPNGCNLGLDLDNSIVFNFLTAGNFGVSLFFILSGYVLTKPTFAKPVFNFASWSGDVAKRIIRLGIPLYTFCLIAFICLKCHIYENSACAVAHVTGSGWLQTVYGDIAAADQSALLTLASPFEFSARLLPPAWTIGLELVGSFLSYGLAAIIHSSSAGVLISFLALLCAPAYLKLFVVGTLFAYVEARGKLGYDSFRQSAINKSIFFIVPLFLVCVYLDSFPWFVNSRDIRKFAPSYLPLLGLNSLLCKYGIVGGVNTVGAVMSFLAAKLWLANNELLNLIAGLGKHTYTVYLSHFILIGTVCSFALLHLVQPGFANYYMTLSLVLLVLILSIMVTCYALTEFIDGNAIRLAKVFKGWYLKSLSSGTAREAKPPDGKV